MVILDAITSVNQNNQYYNNGRHQSPSSSYKNSTYNNGSEKKGHRHYPGKAVDVSLSLEPSNAMGALYEANWLNAQQTLMKKPQSPPQLVGQQPRKLQPECHSPPHLRNKPRREKDQQSTDRESSSSPASNGSANNGNGNRLSSLGKYQVTLDQIRRLEEKDANITKTICELNGFKPTTLRRKPRQLYPEWDEHSRNRNRTDEEKEEKLNTDKRQTPRQLEQEGDAVKRSDLVSHFLKLKSNKKFANEGNQWVDDDKEVVIGEMKVAEKFNTGSSKNRDDFEDSTAPLHSQSNGIPMRNSLRFCGGTIDIKDIFRRKKEAHELSPTMNNKLPSVGSRKSYPKTINLTKNLVRDPVVLDQGSQPVFLAEKHRYHNHHHHRSHPDLSHADDELDRERDEEAKRNMKLNQRNCNSSTPTSDQPPRSFEDHDYEVIEYQDVQLREKKPVPQVKRANTSVGRAKSVRINPVADMIRDEVPRNGYAKWQNDRASMPVVMTSGSSSGGKSKDKFNTISPSAISSLMRSSPTSSSPSQSPSPPGAAIRRSKSINPNSFTDTWNRRPRTVREESVYQNAPVAVPPPPPARSPTAAPPSVSSIRQQASMRQRQQVEIRPKLVQSVTPPLASEKCDSDDQDQFVIPRPRLIVPVHTYARKRRTGNLRADAGLEEDAAAKDEGKW